MALPHIIVLHVSSGYEERAAHIERTMARHGLEFEYMLRGDIADIDSEVLSEYFSDSFGAKDAVTSCSYKHLLACKRIVDAGWPGAVVMEDDAVLFGRFNEILPEAVRQLDEREKGPAILSLEDTRLRFVPRSRRRRGVLVYPGDRDRLAGCYYINRAGAEAVLAAACGHKLDRPIDTFHRLMLDRGEIAYWWLQPPIATQGSFTGLFPSSLSTRYSRIVTPVVWKLKLSYRKLLYWLR